MRKPLIDIRICKKRRESLREAFKGGALILASAVQIHHVSSYRQNGHFFFLTGFEEPESFFLFRPGKDPESVLFVRKKDPIKETWEGYRFGPEGAVSEFAMDEAYPIEEFSERTPKLLKEVDSVYYGLGHNCVADSLVQSALQGVLRLKHRTGLGLQTIIDPHPILGEQRIIKDDHAISMMTEATRITAEAHMEVMKSVRTGVTEKAMHGLFIYEIMSRGATRESYGSILASGDNALTLHYMFNDRVMNDGDFLLIDAGAEYNFFAGDLTRAYPVNGRFTHTQKRIYEKVLKVQKDLIALAKPGFPFADFQTQAVEKLVEVMLSEKILTGNPKDIIESGDYKKFYPHTAGHWLGMDVHDVGLYQIDGESRRLEPGMCLTVEPGLYIPRHETSVPEELRGLGIRIEDDILITQGGCINMTEKCPREVEDLERLIGRSS